MKIETVSEIYEKDAYGVKKGDVRAIRASRVAFCCEEMEIAYNEKFIVFGEHSPVSFNKLESVNVVHCDPWPEGAVWSEMPIRFCPFCGKNISVERAEAQTLPFEAESFSALIDIDAAKQMISAFREGLFEEQLYSVKK